jgi:hypothetical protein
VTVSATSGLTGSSTPPAVFVTVVTVPPTVWVTCVTAVGEPPADAGADAGAGAVDDEPADDGLDVVVG